ncbi:MAG: Ryanodine receptor Ryr [Bacteroidales bacterium]|nr:Ryanodine receptor Ryr [Bacteroidales bacterium]
MENNEYIPHPVDTSDVELPAEIMELAEVIARNVHEVWAESRLREGWTYGEVRDDAKRQTPCLVEYDELSDEEKSYDLNTALGTLRLITKLGFRIIKE